MDYEEDYLNILGRNYNTRNPQFKDASLTQVLRTIIREKTAVKDLEEELARRILKENQVRKIKRAGEKCPYEKKGMCSEVLIRCGERQQFNAPELVENRTRPHKCNYQPRLVLNAFYVLVVDDEPMILDLCKEFFSALGISEDRIETAGSVQEAQEILKQGKISNRQYCIVLSDIKMGQNTGFDLVNHLVERNYNSRILLMSGFVDESDFPSFYLGDKEIIPGKRVVSKFLRKPINFSDFTAHIRQIEQEFMPGD